MQVHEIVRRMRHMHSRKLRKGKITMDADTVKLGRERRLLLGKLSRRRSLIGELQTDITTMQRQLAGIEAELAARHKHRQANAVPTAKTGRGK